MSKDTDLNEAVLTFDLDWAPDFAVNFIIDQLLKYKKRATWFITHPNPSLERLREHPDLFELGIHPNFLPSSTQGKTVTQVLKYCMSVVPEAVCIRMHSLVQSTLLLEQIMQETPITTDVSLFLPFTPSLRFVEYCWKNKILLRIPFYCEDAYNCEQANPSWKLGPLLRVGKGLKVFNFHPIHIYLNLENTKSYRGLKKEAPDLTKATHSQADKYVNKKEGTRTLFMDLLQYYKNKGQLFRLCDLREIWQKEKQKSQQK